MVVRLIHAPRCEFFTSWTKTERASKGGVMGTPIDQLTREGLAKGLLVWAFHLRVREKSEEAVNEDGGVYDVAAVQGLVGPTWTSAHWWSLG